MGYQLIMLCKLLNQLNQNNMKIEKQLTAVEWLQMKMATAKTQDMVENINVWFAKAKEMHKKEIMDAWHNGFEENRPYVDHSEDYYNETFKSE